jgi:hypothetical protein
MTFFSDSHPFKGVPLVLKNPPTLFKRWEFKKGADFKKE